MPTLARRLLLAVAGAALALLAAQGFLSLAFGRSLRDLGARTAPARDPDEPGLYVVDPDPLVGYVLRPNADLAIHDGRIRSDELGLRSRPGPSRGPDAQRLVVLGDSLAFGFGLDDDETLAHRLELLLNASGARPVECRTVAMPGWNHRNAVHFLLDHLDVLAPDVVVYLPISNDLLDTDAMDANGHRTWAPDLCAADPWLAVCWGEGFHLDQRLMKLLEERGTPELSGSPALMADITPESTRRFDENADSIELLSHTLAARGGRLMLAHYREGPYTIHLQRRLDARGLQAPVVPLFRRVPSELTLGFDPHPNADTVAGLAVWIAAALMEQGWVAGEPARLPAVSPEMLAARATAMTPAAVAETDEALHGVQRSLMRPVVDLQTGEGVSQVLGGVHDDGSIGGHALFALRRAGPTLRVRLAPIARRPDLYPLAVQVEIDGRVVGAVQVTDAGPAEGSFDVPPAGAAGATSIEVRLMPDRAVVTGAPDHEQLAACQVLRLACE